MSAVAEELLQDTTGEVVSEGQPAGTRREDDTHQAEFDIQAETEERRQALEAQERAEEERTRIETQAVATGLVRIGGVWKEPQQAPASHRIAEEIERIDAELDATDRNKLKSRKASLERQMQEAIRQELQAVPRPEELNEIIERQHELDAAADEALATLIDAIDATLEHREKEYEGAIRAARKAGIMVNPASRFDVRRSGDEPGIKALGNRANGRGIRVLY